MTDADAGSLIIISGPSGAGKTSVVRELLETYPRPLKLSVSATTRPPRQGERDGVDYHFLSDGEFQRRRERGEFLECCEVFGRGHWYGTLRSEVETGRQQGQSVILEIDVQGAMKVVQQVPDAISIFIRPGTLAELERRLRGRGTETEDKIQRRLEVATRELSHAGEYRYQIINETIERSVREIAEILMQHGV
ncbi:MAG: guanylate kinase [Pirellulaceae bacterium]